MLPTPCACSWTFYRFENEISGRFNHLRVNNEVVEQAVIVFETYITWKITRSYVIFHVLHVKLWGPLIRIVTICRRGENEWGLHAVLLVNSLFGETDTIHVNAAFESREKLECLSSHDADTN